MPLETVLRGRCSVREFSGAPISLADLSRLLALSYGVIGQTVLDDGVTLRPGANAFRGACTPLSSTRLSYPRKGWRPGSITTSLSITPSNAFRTGDLRGEIENAVLYPEVVAAASLVLLMGAVFHRHSFKYGERGYRFTMLDAGHVGQNVYLVSTALGLGTVAIGGYLDDATNHLVECNGVDEGIVYVMAVGQPFRANEQKADHIVRGEIDAESETSIDPGGSG